MDDRARVLAFRAAGHHLDRRLDRSDLDTAVAAVGVRNAQGSGLVSLHARVDGLARESLTECLDRATVVEVASIRGVSMLVPVADVATFTLGSLPADEESLRRRLKPLARELDLWGRPVSDALRLACDVARQTLASAPVDIGVLSGALTKALPELSPMCRGRCGVAHIDQGLFDLVGESGVWRRTQLDGSTVYVALEETSVRRDQARAALVRRYLRGHGPSRAREFAEWCGISTADAKASLATDEITEVSRGRYLLSDSLEQFDQPSPPSGVRLLPPRDPYLDCRDRATLVPEREVQKTIWPANPTVGVVLADGEPVATWKTKQTRRHLRLLFDDFSGTLSTFRDELAAEAAALAALRDSDDVEVEVVT